MPGHVCKAGSRTSCIIIIIIITVYLCFFVHLSVVSACFWLFMVIFVGNKTRRISTFFFPLLISYCQSIILYLFYRHFVIISDIVVSIIIIIIIVIITRVVR